MLALHRFAGFAAGTAPGTAPGIAPGTTPGMAPGTTPGMAPGTRPGVVTGGNTVPRGASAAAREEEKRMIQDVVTAGQHHYCTLCQQLVTRPLARHEHNPRTGCSADSPKRVESPARESPACIHAAALCHAACGKLATAVSGGHGECAAWHNGLLRKRGHGNLLAGHCCAWLDLPGDRHSPRRPLLGSQDSAAGLLRLLLAGHCWLDLPGGGRIPRRILLSLKSTAG